MWFFQKQAPASLNQRMFDEVLNSNVNNLQIEANDQDLVILVSSDGKSFICSRKILMYESHFWHRATSINVLNKGNIRGQLISLGMYISKLRFSDSKMSILFGHVDEKTLTEILRYIYTGKCADKYLHDCIVDCLIAAEKYLSMKFKFSYEIYNRF